MGLSKLKEKLGVRSSKNEALQPGIAAVAPTLNGKVGYNAVHGGQYPAVTGLAVRPLPTARNADRPIRELWNLAYEKLGEEDRQLINNYESKLRENMGTSAMVPINNVRDQMAVVLRTKMDEVNRDIWKLKFGESEVQVKDMVKPVLSVVDWANDYISDALSANPYASMAWAGVSLMLPFLLNPSEQGASLAKGLEYISSIIVQSRMREELYTRRYETVARHEILRESHAGYKDALESLYRKILKFQAASYCYYASRGVSRLGRDVLKWNDWDGMLGTIREQERVFASINETWKDHKYDEECLAAEQRHKEAMRRWNAIGTDVSGLRQAIEKAQLDKERKALLHWLCEINSSELYNAARDKHETGTSSWLLKKSKVFKAWEKSSNSVLWLHGKVGSGKSILSSSVIHHLRSQYGSDPGVALAYFYFSFTDKNKQKASMMLASLIKQLCASRPDTPQAVQILAAFQEREERPDTKTLEAALLASTRGFSAVYLVIDGLDECPIADSERRKLMDCLRRIVNAECANIHLFCTSRRESDIDTAMSALLSKASRNAIDLSTYRSELNQDIELYIESVLASDDCHSWPSTIKNEVKKTLVAKADGMFQYVSFQLDALRNLSSPGHIYKALQNLPIGLDATYDRLLQNLEPEFQLPVLNSLKWLAFSSAEIILSELSEMFIIHPERAIPFNEDERAFTPEDVLKYFSGLINIQEPQDAWPGPSKKKDHWRVRLAHFSVKEYLTSNRIAKEFSFTETDAHLHISSALLAYHLHKSAKGNWIGEPFYHLAFHAAKYWMGHLEMVPRISWPQRTTDNAASALVLGSQSFETMIRFLPTGAPRHMSLVPDQPVKQLRYTTQLGCAQITEMLLQRGPGTNGRWSQADLDVILADAAHGGWLRLVQLLVSIRANVNAKDKEFGTVLQAAVCNRSWKTEDVRRSLDVVTFLLDSGAKINVQHAGEGGSALQAACSQGQSEIVQLLVDRGANIDYPSNPEGCVLPSVLEACKSRGDAARALGTLRLLLDHGANTERQGSLNNGTALYWAALSFDMCLPHFYLLLDRGADVNTPGGEHGSVLQALIHNATHYTAKLDWVDPWISRDDYLVAISRLLDLGASVNARGGEYGTPLIAAVVVGNAKMIRLLLDRGADPNIGGAKYRNALHAVRERPYRRSQLDEHEDLEQLLRSRGARV